MKIGYTVNPNADLFEQLNLSKKFDFVEITFDVHFNYSDKEIENIIRLLDNFLVIGHIHWELKFNVKEDHDEIIKSIGLFSKFGARIIVIHQSEIFNLEENVAYLKKIKEYCDSLNLELLLENTLNFETTLNILNSAGLSLTLDTAHALAISQSELDKFFSLQGRIKHLHLGNHYEGISHTSFSDKQLEDILSRIIKLNKDLTISFEIFKNINDGQVDEMESEEKVKLLLSLKNKIIPLLRRQE
ncbi:TIM barrel protein [Candidatus Pacearchaeota archaeon]|nr:TIM barrel protein [Candidatus Pacearchaeota archaeon]